MLNLFHKSLLIVLFSFASQLFALIESEFHIKDEVVKNQFLIYEYNGNAEVELHYLQLDKDMRSDLKDGVISEEFKKNLKDRKEEADILEEISKRSVLSEYWDSEHQIYGVDYLYSKQNRLYEEWSQYIYNSKSAIVLRLYLPHSLDNREKIHLKRIFLENLMIWKSDLSASLKKSLRNFVLQNVLRQMISRAHAKNEPVNSCQKIEPQLSYSGEMSAGMQEMSKLAREINRQANLPLHVVDSEDLRCLVEKYQEHRNQALRFMALKNANSKDVDLFDRALKRMDRMILEGDGFDTGNKILSTEVSPSVGKCQLAVIDPNVFTIGKLGATVQESICCSYSEDRESKGTKLLFWEKEKEFRKLSPEEKVSQCISRMRHHANASLLSKEGALECGEKMLESSREFIADAIKGLGSLVDTNTYSAIMNVVKNPVESFKKLIQMVKVDLAARFYNVQHCNSFYETEMKLCAAVPQIIFGAGAAVLFRHFIMFMAKKITETQFLNLMRATVKASPLMQVAKSTAKPVSLVVKPIYTSYKSLRSSTPYVQMMKILKFDASIPIRDQMRKLTQKSIAVAGEKLANTEIKLGRFILHSPSKKIVSEVSESLIPLSKLDPSDLKFLKSNPSAGLTFNQNEFLKNLSLFDRTKKLGDKKYQSLLEDELASLSLKMDKKERMDFIKLLAVDKSKLVEADDVLQGLNGVSQDGMRTTLQGLKEAGIVDPKMRKLIIDSGLLGPVQLQSPEQMARAIIGKELTADQRATLIKYTNYEMSYDQILNSRAQILADIQASGIDARSGEALFNKYAFAVKLREEQALEVVSAIQNGVSSVENVKKISGKAKDLVPTQPAQQQEKKPTIKIQSNKASTSSQKVLETSS